MPEDAESTEGATALLELLLQLWTSPTPTGFPLPPSCGSHPGVPLTCWNFPDIYG